MSSLSLPSIGHYISRNTPDEILKRHKKHLVYYKASWRDIFLKSVESVEHDRYDNKTRYSLYIRNYKGWKVSCLHAGYFGYIPEYEKNPELAIRKEEKAKSILIPKSLLEPYNTAIKSKKSEDWDRLHLLCCSYCPDRSSDTYIEEIALVARLSSLAITMLRSILLSEGFARDDKEDVELETIMQEPLAWKWEE